MMKKLIFLMITAMFPALIACGQRPSPAAKVSETTTSGITISIDYSQPGVKGRKIFGEGGLQPPGVVWRAGANETTLLQVSKPVKLEGKTLPAGKYGIYMIPGNEQWTLIISKKWDGEGSAYDEKQDLFRIPVTPVKSPQFTERLVYEISKAGVVSLIWANTQVNFSII